MSTVLEGAETTSQGGWIKRITSNKELGIFYSAFIALSFITGLAGLGQSLSWLVHHFDQLFDGILSPLYLIFTIDELTLEWIKVSIINAGITIISISSLLFLKNKRDHTSILEYLYSIASYSIMIICPILKMNEISMGHSYKNPEVSSPDSILRLILVLLTVLVPAFIFHIYTLISKKKISYFSFCIPLIVTSATLCAFIFLCAGLLEGVSLYEAGIATFIIMPPSLISLSPGRMKQISSLIVIILLAAFAYDYASPFITSM